MLPPEKIKVVINRYSSDGALGLEQIEKAIRQPIAITIPNASVGSDPRDEYRQPRACPIARSEFASQMKKWAATLVPDAEPEIPEPKRKFAFWN